MLGAHKVVMYYSNGQSAGPNWTYNGDIYLHLNAPTGGSLNHATPGSYVPAIGDRISSIQYQQTQMPPYDQEANMTYGNYSSCVGSGCPSLALGEEGIVNSVEQVQLIDNNGFEENFLKIRLDTNIVPNPTATPSNNSMKIKNHVNSSIPLFGETNDTPMTDHTAFTASFQRQSAAHTFDTSGIVSFAISHNPSFMGVQNGDEIASNPTYPNGGYIANLNLSTDINVLSSLSIVDANGTPVLPTGQIPGNATGGTFSLKLGTAGANTLVNFTIPLFNALGKNLMFFNPNRILNFNVDKIITAKNIIDDMLFWSDGIGEPKKINISRSKQGTDSSGEEHTNLQNLLLQPPNGQASVREQHATVIKKSPTRALTVITESYSDQEGFPKAITEGQYGYTGNIFAGGSQDGVESGESILISYSQTHGLKVGDVLKISSISSELPDQYEIRAVITEYFSAGLSSFGNLALSTSWIPSGNVVFRIEILSIVDDALTCHKTSSRLICYIKTIQNQIYI